MSDALEWTFWIAIVLGLYTVVGYPAVLFLIARFKPVRPVDTHVVDVAPTVSIVITSRNESTALRTKLENTLALDWCGAPLDIVVVSDASTDDTAKVGAEYRSHGVRVIALKDRSGKHVCQGEAVRSTSADLVIFTDVTTTLSRYALQAIVRPFSDVRVGCVSGVDRAQSSGSASDGETLYVRYEMMLRGLEARVGSLVSASGCFFAVRRSICADWRDDVTSDFALPLLARLAGLRTVAEERAICRYGVLARPREEFERKVRTVKHGMEALIAFRRCLDPRLTGAFAGQLWSHKVFRWMLPFVLLTCFLTSALLAPVASFYAAAFYLQSIALAAATIGALSTRTTRYAIVRWPFFVILVSGSMIVAWWRTILRVRPNAGAADIGIWEPTAR